MLIEKREMIKKEPLDTSEGYLRYSRKKWLFLGILAVILVILSLFTIKLGTTDLSFWDILQYIFHPDKSWDSSVVWNLRLRLIVAAILAGSALGVAGSVMQSILRNPLASPFTLGLSNAAAFGASLGILFLQGGVMIGTTAAYATISNPLLVTVLAFIFAMAATGIMILLVKLTECTPETIILAGLAISSIFSAGLAFLQFIANDVALSGIVFWQFGSLSKVTWNNLYIIAAVLIISALYFIYKRWDYNAMEAGEDVASGLGVNIKNTRYVGLIVCAILTAVVVSFMGVIGFIGLIGPHIVKRVIGNDNRYVLLGSMLVGSIVLLIAYVIGSYAFYTEIPVGIITSAVGGPLFILILLRGRRKR
ncbi:cobalamin import system permease protein BtuC [Candidatus Methanoplasma termitum]|uniref:BtuC3 protein n=1 Tax=Candidatus Methanoplasma termitum TaxID=1577791 RepID=A0A0A7LEF5_9ARCH|nr:iron ABC transporter permease [Candidatus Methanoplasma termitum]AIZ56677.1 cobalamin import system permease protein BtuC [Candidatus Methanoplasma termitum]MCL2333321.1 iron ABC transporter permease [Candidatus Methanoplasma sp.]